MSPVQDKVETQVQEGQTPSSFPVLPGMPRDLRHLVLEEFEESRTHPKVIGL